MRISKAMYILNSLILIAVGMTGFQAFQLISSIRELENIEHNRLISIELGNELRKSSEYLTANVRVFAATGDKKALDAYNNIVDIRAGNKPRPSDSYIAPGQKRNLLDLLKENGATEQEMALVNQALQLSNKLIELEVEAMNAVEGRFKDSLGQYSVTGKPNLEKAVELVFGQDYQNFTASIMAPLDQFNMQLNERCSAQVNAIENKVTRHLIYISICIAVTLCCGLVCMLYVRRKVVKPLEETVSFAESAANGDIHSVIAVENDNELGRLRKSLNDMLSYLNNQLSFSDGVLRGMTVPCSVFSPQDVVVFTNQHMLNLLDHDGVPENFYGLTSSEYIWGDKNKPTLSTRALKEKKFLSATMNFTTRRGNEKHANVTTAPFYDKAGKMLGTLSIWMEITEMVRQQREISAHAERNAQVAAESMNIADSVSTASLQLASQVELVSNGAQSQSERVMTTATAMNEMNATIVEIARNAGDASGIAAEAKHHAENGYNVVNNLLQSIDKVKEITDILKESMGELSTQANDIGHIMNVISDIADQTNLLALNAAIEAARAGEAGRGFAVVADSVRQLAEKTMQATGEVSRVISGIQGGTEANIKNVGIAVNAIRDSSELSQEAGSKLKEIVAMVDNTAMQIQSIATASEEQSVTCNSISQDLDSISQVSQETSAGMREAQMVVDNLAGQATTLRELIDRLK